MTPPKRTLTPRIASSGLTGTAKRSDGITSCAQAQPICASRRGGFPFRPPVVASRPFAGHVPVGAKLTKPRGQVNRDAQGRDAGGRQERPVWLIPGGVRVQPAHARVRLAVGGRQIGLDVEQWRAVDAVQVAHLQAVRPVHAVERDDGQADRVRPPGGARGEDAAGLGVEGRGEHQPGLLRFVQQI